MPYNRVRCLHRRKDEKEESEDTEDTRSFDDESHTLPDTNENASSHRQRQRRSSATCERVTLASIEKTFIGPYVALDCEMVGVGPGGIESAVARVSAVKWSKEEVILDTFVKVPEPVTDYRTFVSGVTKEDLESDDAIPFEECREIVRHCLKGRVLVGHALSNDLKALNLEHPARDIRDTSTYVPFMQVVPRNPYASPGQQGLGQGTMELRSKKLKDLAKEKLGLDIQRLGHAHDSVQDARVALRLYRSVREEWERLILWQEGRTFDKQFFQGYENTENGPTLKGKPIQLPMPKKHEKTEVIDEVEPSRRNRYTLGSWFPKKDPTTGTSDQERSIEEVSNKQTPKQKEGEKDTETDSPRRSRYTLNAWFPTKKNGVSDRSSDQVDHALETS